jgi:hypothetical protein
MTRAGHAERAERPGLKLSPAWILVIALALAAAAFMAGRHLYARYGTYRPIALMHVASEMRYRARVDLEDTQRMQALAPLLAALDPRGTRLRALERRSNASVRELALGIGTQPSDFVLVIGLQLQAGSSLPPSKALCDVLREDGIRSEPSPRGCRFSDGTVVAEAASGALLVASREGLIRAHLGRPEIGDRIGFSGPSVRGTAPDIAELRREAAALGRVLAPNYP